MQAVLENLDQIVARKRHEQHRLEKLSVSEVRPSVRDLGQFVGSGRQDLAVLVELRRRDRFGRSPPREDLDLVELALALDDAGVDAVTIGTDPKVWGCSLEDLSEVSDACETMPILRRDVLLTAEDVYASRLAGADAVLLMPTIIDDFTMHELSERARSTHMAAVAECWNERCILKAVDADIRMLSVTAWDEEGRDRDVRRIERLAALVPPHITVLAGGGLTLPEIKRLRGQVDGVILGEVVLSSRDPATLVRRIRED